jgi:nitroreductase
LVAANSGCLEWVALDFGNSLVLSDFVVNAFGGYAEVISFYALNGNDLAYNILQLTVVSAKINLMLWNSILPFWKGNREGDSMDFVDLVQHRQSVRNFLDRSIEREKIVKCLEAARLAPSANNSQPWKFIVVDDPELKRMLCDRAFAGLYSLNSFCRTAPVIVAVISEQSKFLTRIGAIFRGTRFYLIDIGIACEHFVLQAEDLGLGTCWIGWFNEKAVKKALHVPDRKKIDILIAIGYYDRETLTAGHGRDPLNKITSFNTY